MRRTLLCVGVPAGGLRFAKENRSAIFRTRRFLSPKAAANLNFLAVFVKAHYKRTFFKALLHADNIDCDSRYVYGNHHTLTCLLLDITKGCRKSNSLK